MRCSTRWLRLRADRLTYTSPVNKDVYEKIHALRASEIPLALNALGSAAWADTSRMVLAGTSEGGPAVARYNGNEFAGRILYSWSCENNYFVQEHLTALQAQPVLNVMSATDMFFHPPIPGWATPLQKAIAVMRSKTTSRQASC